MNLVIFTAVLATVVLLLTIILIPLIVLFWMFLGVAAVALPVIGAVKANQGDYFRYPVVGRPPV